MDAALLALRDRLVDQGTAELSAAPETLQFTGEQTVDALINDIQSYPHAFVLAALVDRQVDAKIAWRLPGKVRERVGTFEIDDLAKLDRGAWIKVLREPTPLHRFIETMAGVLELGVRRIIGQYGGDASAIWSDTPSSKVVVNRFLEFHGAGPKIATMAANILVRGFHVPMADYGAIDISADVQVCRVMGRLGFVPEDPGLEEVVRAARTLSPDFPGVFDLSLWRIGRTLCRPTNPHCSECMVSDLCAYARRSRGEPMPDAETHAGPAVSLPRPPSTVAAVADALKQLAVLRDEGLISVEDYDAKKAEWLGRI
jgi:endonuclease III